MNKKVGHFVKFALALAVFLGAVYFSFKLTQSGTAIDLVDSFGYFGVLILSLISGFNIVVPVPVVALIPLFEAAGFSLILTIVLMSVGMTLGDAFGYFLGWSGRKVVQTQKASKLNKSIAWLEEENPKLVSIIIFGYAAFVPLPNELLIVPASFAGISFRRIFVYVLLGNFLFNLLVGYGILQLV